MMAATASSRAVLLLPFIHTLLDVILLRKGPEHMPRSVVVLFMAVLLWLVARLASLALIAEYDEQRFVVALFSAIVGCCFYAGVLVFSGKGARIMQTISALIGVSAMLRLIYLVGNTLLVPFLGPGFLSIFVIATVVWSIAVNGHIIAHAIDRHWYVGLAIALAITVMRIALESSIPVQQ